MAIANTSYGQIWGSGPHAGVRMCGSNARGIRALRAMNRPPRPRACPPATMPLTPTGWMAVSAAILFVATFVTLALHLIR